jgi:hypothetical protein
VKGPAILLLVVTALASLAAVLVACDALPRSAADGATEFQRIVGGLGFGSSAQLIPCSYDFSPRLEDGCDADTWPIPGGRYFCPRHGLSLLAYRPPEKHAAGTDMQANRHAAIR